MTGGRFRFGINRWVYLPFEVPPGVRRITVSVFYRRPRRLKGLAGSVLDLGIFGPAGWELGNSAGFRGWSGGARTHLTISETDATPGYLAGPIDPGVWALVLGPVVLNPFGMRWQARIELEHDDARPAPGPVTSVDPASPPRGPGWYRGDLHLHSEHSDGTRTPAELAAQAQAAGLDFIACTDHNTTTANRALATRRPDGLLVIPGQEVTTRHGHWLAVGLPPDGWVDWRYSPRDGFFPACARQVRNGGGMVVAAHPAVPLPTVAWGFGYRHVDAIEVWNGLWNLDDEASLRIWHRLLCRNQRTAAVAGSDSHAPHQAVGRPHTVVRATDLSAAAVLDALRHGRSYLTESRSVALRLLAARASGTVDAATLERVLDGEHAEVDNSRHGPDGIGLDVAGPGQTLPGPTDTLVTVVATVSGAPGARLTIITAAGPVARVRVPGPGTHRLVWTTTRSAARFARVEVRHPRRRLTAPMLAMSNPVWLTPPDRRRAALTVGQSRRGELP